MKKVVVCLALLGLAGSIFASSTECVVEQIQSNLDKKAQELAQAEYRIEAPKPKDVCDEEGKKFPVDYGGYGPDWLSECHNGVIQQPVEYFRLDYPQQYVSFVGSLREKDNMPKEELEAGNPSRVPDFFDSSATSFVPSCNAVMVNISKKKLLYPNDSAVQDIMQQAIEVYNAHHPGEPKMQLALGQKDKISVANLLHAIYIIHKYSGQRQFSAQAVCMLGKTVGADSRDLNIGKGDAYRKNFSNMFGAFAAYMGHDSIYFPGAYVSVMGEVKEDLRFGPSKQKLPDYYWKDYTNHAAYDETLKLGPWAFATLKPIADAVDFTADADADFDTNRQHYWEAYRTLFTGYVSCKVKEEATIDYYNIVEYLAILCSDKRIPSMKPYGEMSDEVRAIFVEKLQK